MMWLVKFADKWFDEMDLEGFTVLDVKDFIQLTYLIEDVAKKIDKGYVFECFFGTNEWIDYTRGEDFKRAFSCEVISKEHGNVLKGLLMGSFDKFGQFPSGIDMLCFLEDEE